MDRISTGILLLFGIVVVVGFAGLMFFHAAQTLQPAETAETPAAASSSTVGFADDPEPVGAATVAPESSASTTPLPATEPGTQDSRTPSASSSEPSSATAAGISEETDAAQVSVEIIPPVRRLGALQRPDGGWEPQRIAGHPLSAAGVTAMALLAYAGDGFTQSDDTPEGDAVRNALRFLIQQQGADGGFPDSLYDHGMVTMAVAEAYGLSGLPELKEPLDKAVAYSLAHQNAEAGWSRYRPGGESDSCATAWQMMALKSASMSGIDVSEEATRAGMRWLAAQTDPARTVTADYLVLTAINIAIRAFYHDDNPEMNERGTRLLVEKLPSIPADDYELWYWGSLAMFQAGNEPFQKWKSALKERVCIDPPAENADVISVTYWLLQRAIWHRYERMTDR